MRLGRLATRPPGWRLSRRQSVQGQGLNAVDCGADAEAECCHGVGGRRSSRRHSHLGLRGAGRPAGPVDARPRNAHLQSLSACQRRWSGLHSRGECCGIGHHLARSQTYMLALHATARCASAVETVWALPCGLLLRPAVPGNGLGCQRPQVHLQAAAQASAGVVVVVVGVVVVVLGRSRMVVVFF